MKKGFIYVSLFVLLVCSACKRQNRRLFAKKTNASGEAANLSISGRDYSITKENAYNDLFLDSLSLEKFIQENVMEDSISENMLDFYNVRNFEFAWFDSKGLTEQALGFRSLYKFNTDSINKQLDNKLDGLLQRESTIDPKDPSIVKIELQLTKRFVEYSLSTFQETNPNHKHFETFVPIKKQPVLFLADSILSEKNKEDKAYAFINPYYHGLKDQLEKFMAIQKKGGWVEIPETKTKWVLGKEYPEMQLLKKRLAATGELAVIDTTDQFTPELQEAIKKFQSSEGITADGKLSAALMQNLNVPVIGRIQQLIINMERMRWMPLKKEGKLILVNIPEFMLHVSEGDKHVIHMAVVVGKEGHNTTMFSDDLTTIVFSPYWNVPPSIVKKEILPAIEKNRNYLAKNHMEIVRYSDGLPEIRQLPGGNNSLGHVKFLFPNSFNIYFHDTPAKSLFENDNRAASHGCIRLSDPVKMANYLLENSPEWTPEKIEEAMNQTIEKWVELKHSVPVIITYYTAWVDENGQLNFRNDIYKNDAEFATKMFSDVK